MSLGLISEYNVKRKTNLGYILEKDNIEYFLHKNDAKNMELEVDEKVQAFLFKDKKNRVAATLELPLITLNRFALCEVVNVFPTGVFINIGIHSKDLMLSKFDLPMDKNNWPIIGDKIPCKMILKEDKLYAKMVNKSYFTLVGDKPKLSVGNIVEAYVYRFSGSGINLVDKDFNVFFVHKSLLKKAYRIGEPVSIQISKVQEEDYNASILVDKNSEIEEAAKVILDYLVNHGGSMVFTTKSSPETIKRVFNMSKINFKNGLGRLYKLRKVLLYDDKTILL